MTKNALVPLNYEGQQVRMMEDEGVTWWVAQDVCEILGLGTEQTRRLGDDEKGLRFMQTLGGKQEMVVINEPGLYSLIFRSNKPEAKKFKRWVTHEVLPSIRKTGGYRVPAAPKINYYMLAEAILSFIPDEKIIMYMQDMATAKPKNAVTPEMQALMWEATAFYLSFYNYADRLRKYEKEVKRMLDGLN